jgi:hypothetical protein
MSSTAAAANAYLRLCTVIVQKQLLREHELPHVTPAHSVGQLVNVCIEKGLLTPEEAINRLPPTSTPLVAVFGQGLKQLVVKGLHFVQDTANTVVNEMERSANAQTKHDGMVSPLSP